MGQVPIYGIIGNGRLARHFCHYLTLLGIAYRQWTRAHTESPEHLLKDCNPILILISDDAIAPFIAAHEGLRQHTLCHCAAYLELPGVHSVHPLMTFADQWYENTYYRQIPFIISQNGPPFAALLPGLPNPSQAIDPENKALYHALCVLSGNFTVILWQKAMRDFATKLSIPAEYLQLYCQQVFRNLLANPTGCLTGPLARGDQETIAAHLQALEGDPFFAVYQAMCLAYQQEHDQ